MENARDISSSTLKLVAITCMTFNHAGYIFYPMMPQWAFLACIVIGGRRLCLLLALGPV